MNKDILEIRWHGRGGQGAITAAKIVANAAFIKGYGGVVMAPTFGTERRGAPIFTSLKLSREKIYDLSPIESPDMVVVLDHLLIKEADVIHGLKPGGLVVINTPKPLETHRIQGFRIAIADVTKIASEAGLPKGVVNSGIIGVFSRASDLIDMDTLLPLIETEFKDRKPRRNADAALRSYQETVMGGV